MNIDGIRSRELYYYVVTQYSDIIANKCFIYTHNCFGKNIRMYLFDYKNCNMHMLQKSATMYNLRQRIRL